LSLATRCSHCGTVFRVVQDQLKVSEGWVRCGRCAEVFNALEGLFDLEREGPVSAPVPLRPAPAPTPMPSADDFPPHPMGGMPSSYDDAAAAIPPAPPPRDVASPATHAEAEANADDFDMADTQFEAREDYGLGLPIPYADSADDRFGDSNRASPSSGFDSRADSGLPLSDGSAMATPSVTGASDFTRASDAPPEGEASARVGKPGFLRRAERSAHWDRPRIRRALALAAGLLSLTLVGQWIASERDVIAARWPETAVSLQTICDVLGCSIEPVRRVESVVVDSSGLTRLEGSSYYRLQVSLRNHDALTVMTPALDFTLTDTHGDALARRVLSPQDLGSLAQQPMPPGSELQLSAVLDLGERRIAGYAVELFYP